MKNERDRDLFMIMESFQRKGIASFSIDSDPMDDYCMGIFLVQSGQLQYFTKTCSIHR